MCKKKNLNDVGLFPLGIKFGEDLAVISKIVMKGPVAVSSLALANYRFALPGGTHNKFTGVKDQFQLTTLLLECPCMYDKKKDLANFVELYTLRTAAVAIRAGKVKDAKELLASINTKKYFLRYYVLMILSTKFFAKSDLLIWLQKLKTIFRVK